MKPDIPQMLRTFTETLLKDVVPALGSAAGEAPVIAIGLYLVAQEFDRACDVLVADNTELRELFAEAAPLVSDTSLAIRMREAAQSREPSLRVSALNRSNDALHALLIELYDHVEGGSRPQARVLICKILTHLKSSAQRRRLKWPAAKYP